MNNQEIFDLMDRFAGSGLRRMKLTQEDFSLELERGGAGVESAATAAPVVAPALAAVSVPEEPVVTAPLAGIFYAAPAPDQPPFVTAGTRVKQGETICLLEAMKIMSEVPAPCDCVIEEVLAATGDLVGYGQPLFRIREL